MELMEVLFVLAILLLIFGPKKLPELAREPGEAVYEFKKASSGILALSLAIAAAVLGSLRDGRSRSGLKQLGSLSSSTCPSESGEKT